MAFDFVVIGLLGVITGVATGVAISLWLIPDLAEAVSTNSELAGEAHIAWALTAVVAAVFVAAILAIVATLVPLLRRLRIFQAIKPGESL